MNSSITKQVIAWAGTRSPPPQVTVLPGVTHFFHGHLQELKAAVFAFVRQEGRGGSESSGADRAAPESLDA